MQGSSRDINRRPEGGTGGVPSWAWKVTAAPPHTLPLPLFSSSSSAAASSGFSNTATTAAPAATPSASLRFDPPPSSSSHHHHRWKKNPTKKPRCKFAGNWSWHFCPPLGVATFSVLRRGWFLLVVDWIRITVFSYCLPRVKCFSLYTHLNLRLTNFNMWDGSIQYCVENHCWDTVNRSIGIISAAHYLWTN